MNCNIIGYALNTIAGNEESLDLKNINGYTLECKKHWSNCISQKSIYQTQNIIMETVKRAVNKAKVEKNHDYTVSLVVSSNFFGNTFWEKDILNYNNSNQFMIGEIINEFTINGLIISNSTACSSGGSAIALACQMIEDKQSDIVMVLGYDLESEIPKSGMTRIGATSNEGIRPFSLNRTGTDLADGIGCLIIENDEMSRKRKSNIYGKIIGYGVGNDAYNPTSPEPTGQALYRAMQNAIEMAQISKSEIVYINAHGSGTRLNDALETNVIKQIFGCLSNKLLINSSKSLIGHTLGAAGVIEVIITIIEMNKGIVHPTANYKEYDDECDLNYCYQSEVYGEIKYALSNSIGFGGLNVCIALERGNNNGKRSLHY